MSSFKGTIYYKRLLHFQHKQNSTNKHNTCTKPKMDSSRTFLLSVNAKIKFLNTINCLEIVRSHQVAN